MITHRHTLG